MNKREIERLIKADSKIDTSVYYQFGKDTKTLPDPSQEILFSCPVCGETYKTVSEAVACRDQPFDNDDLCVGDIVVVPGKGSRWSDEDDPWVAFTIPSDPDSLNHFENNPSHVPYYVVTAIHTGDKYTRHECRVTLARFYTRDDTRHIEAGWNPADGNGHHTILSLGQDISDVYYYGDRIGDLFGQCEPSKELIHEAAILAAMGISTRQLI
jgi:hypothetical protein